MTTLRSHYGAPELASMALPSIPTTPQGVRLCATRNSWLSRQKQTGRGGGLEYAIESLPAEAQAEIRRRAASEVASKLSITATLPATPPPAQIDLATTDRQRLCEMARKGILTAIERIMSECRVSQEAAMTTLLTQARGGKLDITTIKMLQAARDQRGRKGDGFPSVRTLKRYIGTARSGESLVPMVAQKDLSVPLWAESFLSFYRVPQRTSIAHAYEQFIDAHRVGVPPWSMPSIHQVRRFIDKLGNVTREAGRMGPRELKNIRPFVRRTFDKLLPNDVWSPDGHSFDAEVQHPLHGRPFRPEITAFIDIATRRVVGFSVDLAESGIAVLDAIRHGVTREGLLAILYTDHGRGYDNAMMKDEAVGMAGLLGFHVEHSLPYNSQARGVTERSHQSLWVRAARELPSYIGRDMDRQAKQESFKITRAALKHGGALPLMGWELFLRFCTEQVDKFNARPHSTLPKINDPVTGRRRHMTPDEKLAQFKAQGWEPMMLTDSEAQSLFRPRVERTVARGEVSLFGNRYFSHALEEFHGDLVHVSYDIHDAQRIWIYAIDGRFICDAEWGGNNRHYFPMSVVEQARDKRTDARLRRNEVHRDEILAERNGHRALTMETPEVLEIQGIGQITREALRARAIDAQDMEPKQPAPCADTSPAAAVFTLPETAAHRFARWQALDQLISDGGTPETAELKWYGMYPQSKEFAAQKRRAEEAGELQLTSQM